MKRNKYEQVNQFKFKWLGFVYQTDEFQHCPPGFLYLIALSMVIKEVQADEAVLSKRQYQDGKIILFCKIYQSLTTTVVQIVLLSESTLISPDEDLQYAVETSRSISRWIMRQTVNEPLVSVKLFLSFELWKFRQSVITKNKFPLFTLGSVYSTNTSGAQQISKTNNLNQT